MQQQQQQHPSSSSKNKTKVASSSSSSSSGGIPSGGGGEEAGETVVATTTTTMPSSSRVKTPPPSDANIMDDDDDVSCLFDLTSLILVFSLGVLTPFAVFVFSSILISYTYMLHYTARQPANHLSPGMFLCTPKPSGNNHRGSGSGSGSGVDGGGGGASSSLSSRPSSIVPGLTPTNFASDFGKGHRKEDSLNAMDASNGTSSVFSRFRLHTSSYYFGLFSCGSIILWLFSLHTLRSHK